MEEPLGLSLAHMPLIEKGLIIREEFMQKISEERRRIEATKFNRAMINGEGIGPLVIPVFLSFFNFWALQHWAAPQRL
jgi:hypothetical protein